MLTEFLLVVLSFQRDGTGCPFWYWEEDYRKKVMSDAQQRNDANMMNDARSFKMIDAPRKNDISVEVVRLLKSICLLCLCILGVQLAILFVEVVTK